MLLERHCKKTRIIYKHIEERPPIRKEKGLAPE